MKKLATALLFSVSVAAQMQLPPGTRNTLDDKPNAQSEAVAKAENAIRGGRFDEAVKLLQPLATAGQKDGHVFYDLGFAQDSLNQDAEARTAYAAAIQRDGNDVAARVSLGLLLARSGDAAGATDQLRAATKVPNGDPKLLARAHRTLAQIESQKEPQAAREDLLAALRTSPETPQDAALAAEIASALQDDDDAVKQYAHAVQQNPGDTSLAVDYARALSRLKRYDEAVAVLEGVRRAHPENREVMAELASEQMLQGKTAAALPTLEQLHTADPANQAVTLLLARAYSKSGDAAKADATYQAAMAASPDDPALLAEVGDHYIREKRSADAEPILQKALAHPEKVTDKKLLADIAGQLAFAASSNHDPETVLKALALRGTIAKPDAPYSFLLATAHDTLRHTKLAAAAYRQFLQQSAGKFPDQEWQAQQRLLILDRMK